MPLDGRAHRGRPAHAVAVTTASSGRQDNHTIHTIRRTETESMSDDDAQPRQWIVEPPPGPGEISLYFAAGEEVSLTPEQEAALAELLRTLERRDAEVTGFHTPECPSYAGGCGDISECFKLTCKPVSCALICLSLKGTGAASASVASGWNLLGSFGTSLG
jgi:hypothetical protein